MTSSIIISTIGIIIGVLLIIYLVMKGINVFVVALLCSGIVALTGGLNLYDAMKVNYMGGFVDFLKANFFIFLAGTVMGKIMEITNGAKAIARMVVNLLGKERALISIPIACGILLFGGVSMFVASFAVFPIALEIFREADLPRRFIPATLCFGCGTFAMVAPGTPQIQNIIPGQYLGTSLTAGLVNGSISCIVMFVLGTFLLFGMVKKEKEKGIGFIAKPMDVFSGDEKLPNGLVALIPLIVCIVSINIKVAGKPIIPIEYGVFLGALLAYILLNKYQDNSKIVENLGEACKTTVLAIANTCAVVAFGGVVKATIAFPHIIDAMISLPGPKLLSVALGTTVVAGACGSASGGLGIVTPLLGPAYIAQGVSASAIHRVMSIASSALDSLPQNGYIVTAINNICNETHKTAYMPVFWLTVFTPFVATIVSVILFTLFPNLP